MGYMIQYNPEENKKYPSRTTQWGKKTWFSFAALTAVVILLSLTFQHRDRILNWVLPGDAPTTAAALQELAANVRSGTPAGEALAVFCREIISHAAG